MEKAGVNCVLLYGDSQKPLSRYAGVYRIATELRDHGYSVQTIDITAFEGFDKDLQTVLANIIGRDSLWVGISTTFLTNIFGYPYIRTKNGINKITDSNQVGIKEFIKFCQQLNPNIKFISGGSRIFNLLPYGFKIFTFYSDKEVIEYTDYLSKRSSRLDLKYLGDLVQGSEYIDFHKSNIKFQEQDLIRSDEAVPVEVSRGCIFKCKFCSFPMNGKTKGLWIKDSQVLYNEFLRNYEHHGVVNYIISDDTYNDSADKVKILYDEVYSKLDFKLNLCSYIRLDLLIKNPETVDYLVASGFVSVLFGIETINIDSGRAIGKGLDPQVQFEFIRELKRDKFKRVLTHSGFILGLPRDRPNEPELLEQFLFSEQNHLDHIIVEPLFISPKDFTLFNKSGLSQFDMEYEKYGYEVYEVESAAVRETISWRNPILNMDFLSLSKIAKGINQKVKRSDKFKVGGFGFHYFLSLGIDKEDLLSLTRAQLFKKYDIESLRQQKKDQYKNNLRIITSQSYK